jgi:hypothetical protein
MTGYEHEINELIPEASRIATKKMSRRKNKFDQRIGSDGRLFNWCYWTELYHANMKRLAIEAGLRTC